MQDYFDDAEYDDDEATTIACLNCKKLIFHDSEQCPNCFEYIADVSVDRHSPWMTVIVWLLIIALAIPGLLTVLRML